MSRQVQCLLSYWVETRLDYVNYCFKCVCDHPHDEVEVLGLSRLPIVSGGSHLTRLAFDTAIAAKEQENALFHTQ